MCRVCDSDGGTDAGPNMTVEDAEVERILTMTDTEVLASVNDPKAEVRAAKVAFEAACQRVFRTDA